MYRELDNAPSIQDLEAVLNNLTNGKTPGVEGVPGDVMKANACVFAPVLHQLLLHYWEGGEILRKLKRDLFACSCWQGVCQSYIEEATSSSRLSVFPESHKIFTLRQLQDKNREQGMPLYIALVDLERVFDTVCRPALHTALDSKVCPPKLLHCEEIP